MTECIAQLPLNFHPTIPLTVTFDAPHISSDGGVLLLRQVDDRLRLSERLAAVLPDARDPRKVHHPRQEQLRQRLYQIVLGYADGNDADRLRHDPLLQTLAGVDQARQRPPQLRDVRGLVQVDLEGAQVGVEAHDPLDEILDRAGRDGFTDAEVRSGVDFVAKTLVAGGGVVGLAAMVEARTGANVFNHLSTVLPVLEPGTLFAPEAFQKFGAAKLRVFGSAEHPIALSAALVVLAPLSVYLARRYRQRRWWLCLLLIVAGCAATVSRTGIVMLAVVGLVFLWLRPRETRRLWPLLIPALLLIKVALPGTLGAIKQSFQPPGGLLAEQQSMAGGSGSGRVADLGPALDEWRQQPLLGRGFGTRVIDPEAGALRASILDNQWLGTLLEVGALGFFGWLWFFARVIRRLGREAKEDDSDRGWLLVALAAGIAAYAVGMLTFDAFSFVQVTFLLFILAGLAAALLAERPTPLAARAGTV